MYCSFLLVILQKENERFIPLLVTASYAYYSLEKHYVSGDLYHVVLAGAAHSHISHALPPRLVCSFSPINVRSLLNPDLSTKVTSRKTLPIKKNPRQADKANVGSRSVSLSVYA